MNLDELRTVQAKERRKDSLQHLRDSFYEDVATYIEDLRAARDRRAERVDNPFSDGEVRRMSDEIEAAEEVAEAVYERRVGKAVKLASFAAAEMPVETEGMTTQERALFDDLVARIEENKTTVLDILAGRHETEAPASANDSDSVTSSAAPDTGTSPAAAPDSSTSDAADASGSDGGLLADAMGAGNSDGADAGGDAAADEDDGGYTPVAPERATGDVPPEATDASESESDATRSDSGAPESAEAPAAPDASTASDAPEASVAAESSSDGSAHADGTDRTTVRIVQDVGAILGVDEREYTLATDDVVTLPSANAEPLLQRNAAERVE